MTVPEKGYKIIVVADGPYIVHGALPLVHKTQIVSEYGEPLAWHKDGVFNVGETYALCRCGHSATPPFCDGSHETHNFDGTETADTQPTINRQREYPGAGHIVVRYDSYLCMNSGFCGTRTAHISQLVRNTAEGGIRALVISMVANCPSGALTCSLPGVVADLEPDWPAQIAVTTDITAGGPIEGALWVTGGIPLQRSDGREFERRNRVTLCRCGHSRIKPLCDGAHRRL